MVGLQSIVEQHDATTDNGFFLAVRDGGKVGSRNTITGSLVTADSWTHIVYTAESGTESIFINGELKQSNNSAPILSSSNQQLYIGNENALGWAFSGTIDELRFYDRPINAAEVKEIFELIKLLGFRKLNDTGVTTCRNETTHDLPCPISGFEGQDGEHGRDVTHNNDSDGHVGFSFTKLDENGNDLAATATSWSCVRDDVTGYIWEVKTTNGSLRDSNSSYSWYNSTGINDGGFPGFENGGNCTDIGNCDTEKYVAAVNEEGLCGANDWRLPSVETLHSIVDYSRSLVYVPAIDTQYFPNSKRDRYLSSSPSIQYDASHAWHVYFRYDAGVGIGTYYKGNPLPVRLVRDGQ